MDGDTGQSGTQYMYVLVAVMIIIFIVIIMYGINGTTLPPPPTDKPKVAYIYSTTVGWATVDQMGENMLRNEKLPDNINVVTHNVSNLDDIPCLMTSLYKSGVRKFVGFSSSEMLKRAIPFFLRHKDAELISNGSTVDDISCQDVTTLIDQTPANVYRLTLTDHQNLTALQKIYSVPNATMLAESGNIWTESMVQNGSGLWPGSKYYFYNSSCPNWVAMDDVVASSDSNNLMIFAMFDTKIISTIIDRYPGKTIYLGDGSYAADITSKRRTVRLVAYFGFNSSIYQKYPDPFVANLMDSLLIFSHIVDNGGTPGTTRIVGYNGDTTFNDTHTREFGRIMTYTHIEKWLPDYIYATSEIGTYMAKFDLFR